VKLLLENWRKYLNEVSFEDAKEILDSKRTLKIVKAYRYDKEQEHPDYPDAGMTTQHRNFKNYLLDLIPDDLTDNQKGTSVLWLLKISREDPKVAADFINGRPFARQKVHTRNSLETFFHHQRFMPRQDLMQVKTVGDLIGMTDAAKEEIQKAQEEKSYRDAGAGTEILRDDAQWKVAIISNKGAACKLGKGTDWCTAAPGLDYFAQYYSPDDPLFYLEDKEGGQRFQFHYGRKQFMDQDDHPVGEEPSELFRLHAILAGALGEKIEQYPKVLKQDEVWKAEILLSDPNSSPEELKDFVDNILSSPAGVILAKVGRHMIDAAKHPNTPPETLVKIIEFDLERGAWGASKLRLTISAAGNPNMPTDTLDYLANANFEGHGGASVRYAVATNPSTSSETLYRMKMLEFQPRFSVEAREAKEQLRSRRANLEERKAFKIKVLKR